jgi:hypothetical protein
MGLPAYRPFERLADYLKGYRNCNVPGNYNNQTLGVWVRTKGTAQVAR